MNDSRGSVNMHRK